MNQTEIIKESYLTYVSTDTQRQDIEFLLNRVSQLEKGLNHIIAESHSYVLNKSGYKHAPVHEMYRRLARRTLRLE